MKKIAMLFLAFLSANSFSEEKIILFADSNCKVGYEFYFLNRAASNTDIYAAQLLLKSGANVDGEGYEKYIECGGGMEYSSPLMVAVFVYANEEMGGDLSRVDRIHFLESAKIMVEFLLKNGANPNIKEGEGVTPLDIATRLKHRATIKLLKKYGAK